MTSVGRRRQEGAERDNTFAQVFNTSRVAAMQYTKQQKRGISHTHTHTIHNTQSNMTNRLTMC